MTLPSDPAEAVAALRAASQETDVVVFKKSPICPVSTRAEFEFSTWLKGVPESSTTRFAMIDVIAAKPLARGLTAELGIDHQSPQGSGSLGARWSGMTATARSPRAGSPPARPSDPGH